MEVGPASAPGRMWTGVHRSCHRRVGRALLPEPNLIRDGVCLPVLERAEATASLLCGRAIPRLPAALTKAVRDRCHGKRKTVLGRAQPLVPPRAKLGRPRIRDSNCLPMKDL